jgi:hypothetical protein
MPEVKNTFLQSKMNKDMDGRILPNGQYRDGRNIQISRSEGDDVGALENVLGNGLLTTFGLTNENLEIIGHLMVDTIDTIFLFLTDYYDSSANQLDNNIAGQTTAYVGNIVECYIVSYNVTTQTPKILVEGNFLNFSKSHPVTGVNLIEDLLFWTDNRNQPRKININLAEPGYYTKEDHISVAKYYPYTPILLLNRNDDPIAKYQSSMKDKVSKYLPIHAAAKVKSVDAGLGQIVVFGEYTNIMPNTPATGISNGDLITGVNVDKNDLAVTNTVTIGVEETTITTSSLVLGSLLTNDIIYFQRQNPDYDINWTGDENFFKDKFARFSYRFKFDDGEYSLSAPFTQIAFVPEQDGYFIGDSAIDNVTVALVGQESATYDSTVVKFMQNKINDVVLNIPSPTIDNDNTSLKWDQVNAELKITEIDILYKEAQSNKTSIVETLLIDDFNINDDILTYNYKSAKPWKTLPTIQTTRVTDVVPIRALAQESSGNRVIYGNFIDKHSSPVTLNYQININEKVDLPTTAGVTDSDQYVRKEYQNHTLKQNRTYQLGVVLSDRYGRQSNVILSSIINTTLPGNLASTFYHQYRSVEDAILIDKYPNWSEYGVAVGAEAIPESWPGDQINAIFWSVIPELKNQTGYPGLYSIADGTVTTVNDLTITNPVSPSSCGPYTVTIEGIVKSGSGPTAVIQFSIENGVVVDVSVISSDDGWTEGQAFEADLSAVPVTPGCAWILSEKLKGFVEVAKDNPLGYYSYKFVIKQTEQEYYNVYLPGALAGYPKDQAGEEAENTGEEVVPANLGSTGGTVTTEESQAFPTVAFKYPKGQQRHTSHIVLFGDNVNKVPKDLQDVGPLTEKFRSSEQLYGRVSTFLLNSLPSNIQYDPGKRSDTVVQIGSMVSLGLGDLTINPIEPTIPPAFYKGETNPLIGRVETNNQFGIVNSVGISAQIDYGPYLAVYETKPVESLLDIFWESTSSGLISDLNKLIKEEDNTIPTGITNVDISWSEEDDFGSYISNTFEAAGANGQGVGPLSSISISQVVRADSTVVTPQFEIEETGGFGSGEYQIKIAPYASDNEGFVCWEDNLKNTYYFDLLVTYNSGLANQPVLTIPAQVTGYVVNSSPKQRNSPSIEDIKDWVFNGTAIMTPDKGQPIGPFENDPSFLAPSCFGQQGQLPYGLIRSNGNTPFPFPGIQAPFNPPYTDPSTSPDKKLTMNVNQVSCNYNTLPGGAANQNWSDQQSHVVRGRDNCTGGSCISDVTFTSDKFFEAANGSFGSDPPAFPSSIYNGIELQYDIPRMYQVSMYLPYIYNYSVFQNYWFGRSQDLTYAATDKCGTFECIFGYNSYIPEPASFTGVNDPLDGIPQGPIYWDFSTDQLDPTLGGESTVGQKLNGGNHYWQDLQTLSGANPDMMNLKQGYNTFYSVEGPKRFFFTDTQQQVSNGGNVAQKISQGIYCSDINLNGGGYHMYLGGIDNNGLGPTRSINDMRFFLKTQPVTQTVGNFTGPRKANIYCGNPNIPASGFNNVNLGTSGWARKFQWAGGTSSAKSFNNGNCEDQSQTINGNTVPPGRYVVTLRVRDKNGSGLEYEWDVPITIPPFWESQNTGINNEWCQDGGCP